MSKQKNTCIITSSIGTEAMELYVKPVRLIVGSINSGRFGNAVLAHDKAGPGIEPVESSTR